MLLCVCLAQGPHRVKAYLASRRPTRRRPEQSSSVARCEREGTIRYVAQTSAPGELEDLSDVDLAAAVDPRLRLQVEDLVATMCKALNDPKRLLLLYALRNGSRSVGELCNILEVPQSNTSQHLAVLRERGLVTTERQGNRILYSLRYPALLEAVDILRSVMAEELARQRDLHSPD